MAHSNSATKGSEPAFSDNGVAPVKALVGGRRLRGLSWNKTHQLWRVRIYYAGKLRFVGRFQDAVTAAKAYDKAACYLYGANAITNFGIESCLADPSEVGSCIVRAKEEAEQSAASHYNPGSINAAHMLATAVEGSNQVPSQQQQEQLATCHILHAGSMIAPPAAAHNQQTQHDIFMNRAISCQQQQQQQQFCLAVTMGLTLPSQQHQQHEPFISAGGVAFASAAGPACGLSAAPAADQGSLVQLFLEMQQQQQQQHLGFGGWQVPDSCPPAPQPSLLTPSTPAAAATCHHLFTQQPQVVQLTATSSFSTPLSPALPADGVSAPPASSSSSAGTARFGLNFQQQQQLQLLSHTYDYQSAQFQQQQQQQSFERQLQAMSLQCSSDGGQTGQTFTAPQTGGSSIMMPARMLSNGGHAGNNPASSACIGAPWLRQL